MGDAAGGGGGGVPGGGLMIAGFEEHSPSAESLRAQFDALRAARRPFVSAADEVTRAHARTVSHVEGAPKQALSGASRAARADLNDLVLALDVGTASGNRLCDVIGDHNRAVRRFNALIAAEPDAPSQRTKKRELGGRYQASVREVEHAHSACARALNDPTSKTTVVGLVAGGHLPLSAATKNGIPLTAAQRDRSHRANLKRFSGQAEAEYVRKHAGDIPPHLARHIDPEAQQILAAEVAGNIENPADIGPLTVAVLGLLGSQKPFAKRLFDTKRGGVSAQQVANAVKHLNDEVDWVKRRDGSKSEDRDASVYDGFLNAAGVGMATYTRTLTSPEARTLAREWADQILRDDKCPHNAAALTLLLREGGEVGGRFTPAFLATLTDEAYEWDKRHGGIEGWYGREAGIVDPDRAAVGQVDSLGTLGVTDGYATDGLANLLGAMGSSPEAAQAFFSSSDPPDGAVEGQGADVSKLEYLLGKREWTDSGPWDYPDNGDGLGEALQAATVGSDKGTSGYDPHTAANIASKTFDLVAESNSNDWPEMRDNLAYIATGYVRDVYDLLSDRRDPAEADGLLLAGGGDALKAALAEIGRGGPNHGTETLTSALLLESNTRVQNQLAAGNPGDFSSVADNLSGIAQTNGDVLGEYLHHVVKGYQEDQQDAADVERAQRELLSKAIRVVADFVPGPTESAGRVVGSAFNTIKGAALEALQDAVSGTPAEPVSSHQSRTESVLAGLNAGMHAQLLEGGYLDDVVREYPEIFVNNAQPPAPLQFKDEAFTEGLLSGAQRAWNEWQNDAAGNASTIYHWYASMESKLLEAMRNG